MIRRLSAILLTVIFVLSASSKFSSQTNTDWEWVNTHFGTTLDSLMPLQRPTGYYVVYRSHRDYRTDVPEYWFMIGYDGNSRGYGLETVLSAHVRAADTSSIYDQLMHMHRSDAKEDAAAMTKKIRPRNWNLKEAGCPSIKKQIEQLEQLQSKPLKLNTDVIVLHPMNHEFHIQAPDGDLNFVIWDDEHPLVKWALETRLALENCAKTN